MYGQLIFEQVNSIGESLLFNGESITEYPYEKEKSELIPYIIHKHLLKWTTDLDLRDKIIKLLIENTEIRLCNLGTTNPSLDTKPKAQVIKGKKKK